MEAVTDQLAVSAGLKRYEIANLARPGHERPQPPVLASSPVPRDRAGAHASDGGLGRWWNAASLEGYLAALRPLDGSAPKLATRWTRAA